jgi:hypothetical protein
MDLVLCKVTARVKDEQYEPTLGSNNVMHSHLPKVFFISFERTLFRLEISKVLVSRHSKLKHIHNMNFCNTYFYRLVLPVLHANKIIFKGQTCSIDSKVAQSVE